MTCKDCIHYLVCRGVLLMEKFNEPAENCKQFQDKDKIIELPIGIKDTVFSIEYGGISIFEVDEIFETDEKRLKFIASNDFSSAFFDKDDIGKTIFFTKAEAEQKLKELKENE